MYLKTLLLVLLSSFFFGCSGKSYPPKEEKKQFLIEESRLPVSVQETVGRYRKEL
jgi:hypothetical protein